MPHPIYGAPQHELESIRLTLYLPTVSNGRTTKLEAHGRASTQRGSLWNVQETWSRDEIERGYQASDAISHLVLVSLQDRPTTQRQLELGLTGQGWEQLQLDM